MQVRCQRCGYTFTLGREAIVAALGEVKESNTAHYNFDCPKCRRRIKVPVKNLRRSVPRQD
jgi:hypothetical protein